MSEGGAGGRGCVGRLRAERANRARERASDTPPFPSPLLPLTKVLAEHGPARLLHLGGAADDGLELGNGRVEGKATGRVQLDGDGAPVGGGQGGDVIDHVLDLLECVWGWDR